MMQFALLYSADQLVGCRHIEISIFSNWAEVENILLTIRGLAPE